MEKLLLKNFQNIAFGEYVEEMEEECIPMCTCGAKLIPKIEEDFIWHPSNSF